MVNWPQYTSVSMSMAWLKGSTVTNCSLEPLSLIRGQLSSSRIWSLSLAAELWPRSLIPSSVMSSQWERESEERLGQWEDKKERVESVIKTHSSRSMRDKLRQFLERVWKIGKLTWNENQVFDDCGLCMKAYY